MGTPVTLLACASAAPDAPTAEARCWVESGIQGGFIVNSILNQLCVVAIVTAMASPVKAETYTVEIADLQLGYVQVLAPGVQFNGITGVTLRAVGVGGRGLYGCSAPAVGGWCDLNLSICLGSGCIDFPAAYGESFDVTQTADGTQGGWQICEGVTTCPIYLAVEPRGIVNYDWRQYCWEEQLDVPPVSRLVIAITADSVVATKSRSWGALKAMYRH